MKRNKRSHEWWGIEMVTEQSDFQEVVALVRKKWGDKALQTLSSVAVNRPGIPTGHRTIDALLGQGAVRGAMTCFSGHPTSGVTTLALDLIARVQADDEVTVLITTERVLDAEYAVRRGIDLDGLLVVWVRSVYVGLDIAHDIVAQGGAGVVVFDVRGATDDEKYQPVRLSRLRTAVRHSAYALVCLTSPPCDGLERALIRAASSHLTFKRCRWNQAGGRFSGYDVDVTAAKTRSGAPYRTATFTVPWTGEQQRLTP